MDNKHLVSLTEVRVWMNAALDMLEAEGVIGLHAEHDNYWQVYFEDAFAFTETPIPVVGSLHNDIEELRDEMQSWTTGDYVAAWHFLHHLGGVVQSMAEGARVGPMQTGDSP